MIRILCLSLFLIVLHPYGVKGQDDVVEDVTAALKAGSSKELVRYLNKSSDIDIDGDRATYSRTQAEVVLKEFFQDYPPTDFTIIHQGASRAGLPYIIGEYSYKDGSYRVWIRMKEEDDQFNVHAMSFYKD